MGTDSLIMNKQEYSKHVGSVCWLGWSAYILDNLNLNKPKLVAAIK